MDELFLRERREAYLDPGLALDVAILRLSLGAGPICTNNRVPTNRIKPGMNGVSRSAPFLAILFLTRAGIAGTVLLNEVQ
jgi:hypothetical protein